jgi:hypothetical protein
MRGEAFGFHREPARELQRREHADRTKTAVDAPMAVWPQLRATAFSALPPAPAARINHNPTPGPNQRQTPVPNTAIDYRVVRDVRPIGGSVNAVITRHHSPPRIRVVAALPSCNHSEPRIVLVITA